jgi:hypothetical protein
MLLATFSAGEKIFFEELRQMKQFLAVLRSGIWYFF